MEFSIANPTEYASVPIEHRFEPYDDNGGWVESRPKVKYVCSWHETIQHDRTSLAIAGKDFCVVASDTRQSTGYNINSRYAPKAYRLADNAVIAMNGFHADGLTLKKVLDQRLKVYSLAFLQPSTWKECWHLDGYSGTSLHTTRKCLAQLLLRCFQSLCIRNASSLTIAFAVLAVLMRKVEYQDTREQVQMWTWIFNDDNRCWCCVLLRCYWFIRTWKLPCKWFSSCIDSTFLG